MALLDDLKTAIFSAVGNALKGKPQAILDYSKTEGEKLAITLEMITEGVLNGTINKDEAGILLNQQKNAAMAVISSAEGMSAVAAQNAINCALDAVKKIINDKLPFALL